MPRPGCGSAPAEEIDRAAMHETAHALVARELGMGIYQVYIHRDASGMCESTYPRGPIQDLCLTAAGYVGECLLDDIIPTWEGMQDSFSQLEDVIAMRDIAEDGRVRGDIAIPAAIRYAYIYLTIPSVHARLVHLSRRLARTRRLDGKVFK